MRVPPDDKETQLPVIICAPVLWGNDLDVPLRLWPDCWDSSVSVKHGESDPGVALLSPDTVWGKEIALHPLEEDSRANAVSVLFLHTNDSSGEIGLMDNGGLAICPQDSRFSFPMGGGVMACYASCISPVWGQQWSCLLWASRIGRD